MNSAGTTRVPPPLKPGGTIGIVAPAGVVDRAALETGCSHLKALGYRTVYLESIFDQDQYFAGTVDRRVNELHEMFQRRDVEAIVAARGGYGCNYLLPFLDLDLIENNFKALVGYSDLTTLHTWLNDQGFQTFHGPMVSKDFTRANGVEMESWRNVLGGLSHNVMLPVSDEVKVIAEGEAEGKLYGGCLSMLVESLGTPYDIHPDGCILFIEDVGVWPYQVDRMLMQLLMAGKLDKVRGVVFGEMSNCLQDGLPEYTVASIASRVLSDFKIPVVMGLRSGHVERDNITLPMGRNVKLAARESGFTLEFADAGAR